VGDYLDLLLTSLAKLEATTDRGVFIEANLARVNIGAILGERWVEKYVLPSSRPDPWMLNGNDDWFKAHPVSGKDIRRVCMRTGWCASVMLFPQYYLAKSKRAICSASDFVSAPICVHSLRNWR
jgi:hypothetical protein